MKAHNLSKRGKGYRKEIIYSNLKNKLKELKYKIRIGEISSKEAKKYLCGHIGYMKIANTKNLTDKLFYKMG